MKDAVVTEHFIEWLNDSAFARVRRPNDHRHPAGLGRPLLNHCRQTRREGVAVDRGCVSVEEPGRRPPPLALRTFTFAGPRAKARDELPLGLLLQGGAVLRIFPNLGFFNQVPKVALVARDPILHATGATLLHVRHHLVRGGELLRRDERIEVYLRELYVLLLLVRSRTTALALLKHLAKTTHMHIVQGVICVYGQINTFTYV